jgi:hypothetical protein
MLVYLLINGVMVLITNTQQPSFSPSFIYTSAWKSGGNDCGSLYCFNNLIICPFGFCGVTDTHLGMCDNSSLTRGTLCLSPSHIQSLGRWIQCISYWAPDTTHALPAIRHSQFLPLIVLVHSRKVSVSASRQCQTRHSQSNLEVRGTHSINFLDCLGMEEWLVLTC